MSETTTASEQNVDLVLANTVSRLGCTVAEARKHIAEQSAAANLTPAKPAQSTSKGGEAGDGDALL